jgi:hypothetical protein
MHKFYDGKSTAKTVRLMIKHNLADLHSKCIYIINIHKRFQIQLSMKKNARFVIFELLKFKYSHFQRKMNARKQISNNSLQIQSRWQRSQNLIF